MKSSIVLHDLELSVRLGCLPEEQLQDQIIALDINMQFSTPPRGCTTDNLDDTYCYDVLISKIKKEIATREFRLIEFLAHEIYHIVRANLPKDTIIGVRVKKKPLILNLMGGVSFYYGDKECVW